MKKSKLWVSVQLCCSVPSENYVVFIMATVVGMIKLIKSWGITAFEYWMESGVWLGTPSVCAFCDSKWRNSSKEILHLGLCCMWRRDRSPFFLLPFPFEMPLFMDDTLFLEDLLVSGSVHASTFWACSVPRDKTKKEWATCTTSSR